MPKKDKKRFFMFTRDNIINYWVQGDRRGMVLAPDLKKAENFADFMQRKDGRKIDVTEIGSIPGETLENLLESSFSEGANCAFMIDSIEGDNVKMSILQRGRDKR